MQIDSLPVLLRRADASGRTQSAVHRPAIFGGFTSTRYFWGSRLMAVTELWPEAVH